MAKCSFENKMHRENSIMKNMSHKRRYTPSFFSSFFWYKKYYWLDLNKILNDEYRD